MSHVTSISTVPLRSLPAIFATVAEYAAAGMNISIHANEVPRMYYSDQFKRDLKRDSEVADYVIRLGDARYDLALLRNEKGEYDLYFDPFGGSIAKVLGSPHAKPGKEAHVAKFLQGYTKHATLEIAAAAGMLVQSCDYDSQGNLQIVAAGTGNAW